MEVERRTAGLDDTIAILDVDVVSSSKERTSLVVEHKRWTRKLDVDVNFIIVFKVRKFVSKCVDLRFVLV